MTSRPPKLYSIAEYEDGFWVEKPDPKAPLEDCVFIQVEGPWKERKWAEHSCKRWNRTWREGA